MNTNTIRTLRPYLYNGTWCFSDPETGLVHEPFVAGMPEIIDAVLDAEGISSRPDWVPKHGFRLLFSIEPFPRARTLTWLRAEGNGNWYRYGDGDRALDGWLCPALFHYFDAAPTTIYFQFEPLTARA